MSWCNYGWQVPLVLGRESSCHHNHVFGANGSDGFFVCLVIIHTGCESQSWPLAPGHYQVLIDHDGQEKW